MTYLKRLFRRPQEPTLDWREEDLVDLFGDAPQWLEEDGSDLKWQIEHKGGILIMNVEPTRAVVNVCLGVVQTKTYIFQGDHLRCSRIERIHRYGREGLDLWNGKRRILRIWVKPHIEIVLQ